MTISFVPTTHSVSIVMYCFNAGSILEPAIKSALSQEECLELLVADGGSTDGSLEKLQSLAVLDSKLRIFRSNDNRTIDLIDGLTRIARGTFISLINFNDRYTKGSLARAINALNSSPQLLMVFGDQEHFDPITGFIHRFPCLPDPLCRKSVNHYSCPPAVVFRRSMVILLGHFDNAFPAYYDLDFWLRAFIHFPNRIGYLPYLQGRTCLLNIKNINKQKILVALESFCITSHYCDSQDLSSLYLNFSQLEFGIPRIYANLNLEDYFHKLCDRAQALLNQRELSLLQQAWLNNEPPPVSKSENCVWYPLSSSVIRPITQFHKRPFGVNLIGHVFEIFGIGEDLRMAAKSLQAAGVPFCVIHHPAANGSACSDKSLEPLLCTNPEGGPFAFNWVCMAAPIHARWLRQTGCDAMRERYTISSWPWETKEWPDAFMPLLEVSEETWPSSLFISESLSAPSKWLDLPLRVMPMAAEIEKPDQYCTNYARIATRTKYSIPAKSILFCYGFDFNSTAIRKNPMAALEVFQGAFPLPHLPAALGQDCKMHSLSEEVALVIKTFPPRSPNADWNWLVTRADEDRRIVLIAESLPRNELLSLYGSCDVFLSLHRSEGFGRGIAEALQLGLDVIATNYGGNTDFCTGPLAHLVNCRIVPILNGSYPFASGQHWAEPDLQHAVKLCHLVAKRRSLTRFNANNYEPSRDQTILDFYRRQFSFAAAGFRYRNRLEEIWSDQIAIGKRLRRRSY